MKKNQLFPIINTISLCVLAATTAYADNPTSSVIIEQDVKHDISQPLRDLPVLSSQEQRMEPLTIIPILHPPVSKDQRKQMADGAVQLAEPTTALTINQFIGIGKGLGSYSVRFAPPDTNGSVGITQYVQWVNADFAVFDKASGNVLPGFPKRGNSIWSGFGGLCETTNRGDPIVKYDQLANRWVLTQFAFTSSSSGPFFQCIAVSTSSDATGTYYRYAYQFDSFNDYGKLGLWPDAYYMTFNMFGPVSTGPRACAFDRTAMLAGKSAMMQCRQLSFNTSGTLLPADLDGQATPPNGNPEYFMSFRAPNTLKLFKFKVNFVTPSNSTFTGPTNITVANFTIACPNSGGDACAKQPNTTNRLDTLSDRLMHRLAYRQFSDHASMVATHTVQGPAPSNVPGIRWYELRFAPGSTTPTVFQQATRAPDSTARFMGSIAMDKIGNMAVGYSLSSGSSFPTVSISARNASDPLNTMNMSQRIFTGSGSQINGLTRWGDYSALAIDPVDDCTFWYTNEYLASNGSFNWSTRIANFKLAGC